MAESGPAQNLIARLDEALSSMTEILNSLLDINQIEAGTVKAARSQFPISILFDHILNGCIDHATAKGIELHVFHTSDWTDSDPRLLEQMIRNLVTNSIKYTVTGKVLLGCLRRGSMLEIAVLDTGIGIPEQELAAIFEEYHQIDNPARDRTLGLGLGLSIVQNLGRLLHHPISVRSVFGKGSIFTIQVPRLDAQEIGPVLPVPLPVTRAAPGGPSAILLVEDEPAMRGSRDAVIVR